jgi:hypothetical protein
MATEQHRKKRLLGDFSILQVLAGALAAMTAAWIASYLGVAGTIVGAAVGSLVASTSTALYVNTLRHGQTALVTNRATAVDGEPGGDERGEGEPDEVAATNEPADALEETRPTNWRLVLASTLAIFGISMLGVVGYELITGNAFGDTSNTSIVRPNNTGHTTEPTLAPSSAPTTPPATTATTNPPTANPTSVPTVEPTTAPTVAPTATFPSAPTAPTAPAPTDSPESAAPTSTP